MERKIGEIFEYKGEWYQCVEDTEDISCVNCCFYNGGLKLCTDEDTGACVKEYRSDAKSICFKKLENVGEPYEFQKRIIQAYKLYTTPFISVNMDFVFTYLNGSSIINIIIKQNKEDMEDLDKIKVRDYTKVEELNVMEEKKFNLKPFDIQKAREGKPVCTRDGRKARIICFNVKGSMYPIIALIKESEGEKLCSYMPNGRSYKNEEECIDNLMMLTEKKEGWINIIKTEDGGYCCKGEVHSDYNDAFLENINALDNRGITVKIEWED